jgi:hypothetical protein
MGAQIEWALFPWLALEFDLGLGFAVGDVFPVIPILAKIGGRPGQMELFFDIGGTIGAGFTIGGTLGFHAGPGILFGEFLYMAGGTDLIPGSIFVSIFGYKAGLKNKK